MNLFTLINVWGIWRRPSLMPDHFSAGLKKFLEFGENFEGEKMLQRATTIGDGNETESTEVDFGIHLYPECFIGHEKTL